MRKSLMVILVGLTLATSMILSGCSNPELERAQSRSKVALRGEFLTENPDVINFPIRIVLAIDCSGSMAGSDPYHRRIIAAENFIREYIDYESVKFDIVLWNNGITNRTNGFTRDLGELQRVLSSYNNTSLTDYVGTINAVEQDFLAEIGNMRNDNAQSANIARMKCIVLFFSDGLPDTGGNVNIGDIYAAIEDMNDHLVEEQGVALFNFHTFFLSTLLRPNVNDYNTVVNLMTNMANIGNGIYTEFTTASTINFINIVDMRLTVEYQMKFVIACNLNVRPGNEIVGVDSDGDGLTDEEELDVDFNHNGRIDPDEVGRATDPTRRDTDGDGLSDYFERKLSTIDNALDPLDDNDSGCPRGAETFDRDRDGLTDCEETIKGTRYNNPDTDRDGIPDGIEFNMGTNPLEQQYVMDSDFDGMPDWLEVQRHTNVKVNDEKIRARYSYVYDIRDLGLIELNQGTEHESRRRRISFDITNIDIMNTLAADGRARGDNVIRFFIAEVPEDMPESNPVYRVADIVINYNDMESRNVNVDSFEAL
ncbi:MAG: hypothetical protein WC799_11070 [Desulfobacteraceae bacterium]